MKTLIFTLAAFAASTGFGGWNLGRGSGWRVVGGANYNAGLKTDLNVSGVRALPYMSAFNPPAGATRSEAEAASKAILNGQRVDLPNGGYIDPDYTGKDFFPDYTWNWHVPAGGYSSGTMSYNYDYVESSSVSTGSLIDHSSTDRDLPGFTVEIQRNLGQWGNFGLDMGFGFNYFKRNDVYKSSGEVYCRTDSIESGSYVSTVSSSDLDDDWRSQAQNPDGSYGVGTFDGPGAMLPLSNGGQNAFSFSSKINNISRSTHSMYLDSSADYEEIELTITAKPYYDITEWFRVVGTLGAAVSRGQLDFDMMAMSDGQRIYSDSKRFSQWDCYGIGGLGGMFHHWHMCLGFDFLARFFDRDIDIDGRNVSGSVERCPWMFRIYAGFEF